MKTALVLAMRLVGFISFTDLANQLTFLNVLTFSQRGANRFKGAQYLLIVRKGYQLPINYLSNEMHRCICWSKYALGKHNFVIHTAVTRTVWSFRLSIMLDYR